MTEAMRRPRAYEMVRPRKPHPYLPTGQAWKVTARYALHLTKTKVVECVRVSAMGVTWSLHLSVAEFNRLFVPEPKK